MGQYVFDNAAPQAAQRFGSLAMLHDPTTERYLEALGVGEGWVCWEVGGGAGSIAAWLARSVGNRGRVLVTDIDPRYLENLESTGLSNLQIECHDIAHDPFPSQLFDLIHARLVLLHIPTADEVLHQLVTALKPGGRLLVEDYDTRFVDRTFPTADPVAAALFHRSYSAVIQLLEQHGRPAGWGRELYQRFRAEGLVDVGMEGQLAIWPGGSARARLDRANLEQVRAEAIKAGLLTDHEIEQVLALLDDPTVSFSSPIMFSAWGRRPTP
jgi:ubiquinone/menaquinone biosynthesis C-methylase UbiE